ncbi:MAG TPA: hypothetical protein VIJ16_07045, partial [Gemmatimonadaceae bacterium]
TPLALVVTDASGATATAYFAITVAPPPSPTTTLSATPNSLWPPDHNYNTITVSAVIGAACGGTAPVVGGYVVSNEPDNSNGSGDGNTTGDVRVTLPSGRVLLSSNSSPQVAFDPLTDKLQLRAERAGNNSDRVYSIVLTLNGAPVDTATVVVGHDQGKNGSSGGWNGGGASGDKGPPSSGGGSSNGSGCWQNSGGSKSKCSCNGSDQSSNNNPPNHNRDRNGDRGHSKNSNGNGGHH